MTHLPQFVLKKQCEGFFCIITSEQHCHNLTVWTRPRVYAAACSWCVWWQLRKMCYDMLKMHWMVVKRVRDREHRYGSVGDMSHTYAPSTTRMGLRNLLIKPKRQQTCGFCWHGCLFVIPVCRVTQPSTPSRGGLNWTGQAIGLFSPAGSFTV